MKTLPDERIDTRCECERLREINRALLKQIDEMQTKNEATEKLMISQSRMAIMGEMIGMIAHQWRQPITVIGMLANNTLLDLQLGSFNAPQMSHDLQLIDNQVHFLSRTIDDFRNFFRPNKLPQRVTFREIHHELMNILGKGFESRRIDLRLSGEIEHPFVTYKNELLQVLLNLLNNAKDAFGEQTNPPPLIRFEISENDDSLFFRITDNAGGISPEIFGQIFEPYFSTKHEKNGTGLGLYMSAMIVEKHLKGSIRCCSEGGESTFVLRLPKHYDTKETHVY
jgi:two-component system, NtrC family, C4-dicarboxylate transport sensor histidine kinase DctB